MQTVGEIYNRYDILPDLRKHQLRVAAVAKMLCLSLKKPVGTDQVVRACLFHDMGNIIKFNFSDIPESFEPLGVKYWRNVKNDFIKKYGTDEHAANLAIAREIGLERGVIATIDHIGFNKLDLTNKSGVFEYMIATYADCRVTPYGVDSIAERLREGGRRHAEQIKSQKPDEQKALVDALNKLETSIFSETNIKPEDLNDQSAAPVILELEKYSF